MTMVDTLITIRILKMLTTPIPDTAAYRLGIVDRDGKKIRDPKTEKEQESYDMLNRLIFRLKRIINMVPANRQFLSYAAAYALVRESMLNQEEPDDLEFQLIESVITEKYKYTGTEVMGLDFKSIFEDGEGGAPAAPAATAPTNTTKNIAGTITGVGRKSKLRYFRRSKQAS